MSLICLYMYICVCLCATYKWDLALNFYSSYDNYKRERYVAANWKILAIFLSFLFRHFLTHSSTSLIETLISLFHHRHRHLMNMKFSCVGWGVHLKVELHACKKKHIVSLRIKFFVMCISKRRVKNAKESEKMPTRREYFFSKDMKDNVIEVHAFYSLFREHAIDEKYTYLKIIVEILQGFVLYFVCLSRVCWLLITLCVCVCMYLRLCTMIPLMTLRSHLHICERCPWIRLIFMDLKQKYLLKYDWWS